jgi:ABC-type nickel/cobalt efflux system permease component RcnA
MVVLALVLLILVVVFSVAIVVSNPAVYDLSLFRVLVPVTSAGVYFTGIGAALVTVVALLLLRVGIRRSREQRQRLRTAEQAATRQRGSTPVGSSGAGSSVASDASADEARLPRTSQPADDPDAPASGPTANLELDPPTAMTPAERRALLDEVDGLSRDEPKQ